LPTIRFAGIEFAHAASDILRRQHLSEFVGVCQHNGGIAEIESFHVWLFVLSKGMAETQEAAW
jgi:hypothetical protein